MQTDLKRFANGHAEAGTYYAGNGYFDLIRQARYVRSNVETVGGKSEESIYRKTIPENPLPTQRSAHPCSPENGFTIILAVAGVVVSEGKTLIAQEGSYVKSFGCLNRRKVIAELRGKAKTLKPRVGDGNGGECVEETQLPAHLRMDHPFVRNVGGEGKKTQGIDLQHVLGCALYDGTLRFAGLNLSSRPRRLNKENNPNQ